MHGPTEFYDLRHHRLAERRRTRVRDLHQRLCAESVDRDRRSGRVGRAPGRPLRRRRQPFAPTAHERQDGPLTIACVGVGPVQGTSRCGSRRRARCAMPGWTCRLVLVGGGPPSGNASSGLSTRLVCEIGSSSVAPSLIPRSSGPPRRGHLLLAELRRGRSDRADGGDGDGSRRRRMSGDGHSRVVEDGVRAARPFRLARRARERTSVSRPTRTDGPHSAVRRVNASRPSSNFGANVVQLRDVYFGYLDR